MRAAVGMAQLVAHALDHLVAEALADLVSVDVCLGSRVAHEVGQQALDDPVLAHDLLGPLAPRRGEDRLLLAAPAGGLPPCSSPALAEPASPEPLQHLAGRRTGDAQHLGDAGGERWRPLRLRSVLADREGEEVDRLEVLVDRMSLCHAGNSTSGPL